MAEVNYRLQCSICLSDFIKPKILPCFHTFCEHCLEDYFQKFGQNGEFSCMLCRRSITVPEGGVKNFTTNFYCNEIEENLTETKSEELEHVVPLCDVCKSDVISKYKCQDCNQFMCNVCKSTHDSFSGCVGHVMSDLTDLRIRGKRDKQPCVCLKHSTVINAYCTECCVVICEICRETDHQKHPTIDADNMANITDALSATDNLIQINSKVKKRIWKLNQHIDAVTSQMATLKKSTAKSCDSIDDRISEICKYFKNIGESMKTKTRVSGDAEEMMLTREKDDLKKLTGELQDKSERYSDAVETKAYLDILHYLPEAKQWSINNLKMIFSIPDVKLPEFNSGEKSDYEVASFFGELKFQQRKIFQYTFSSKQLKPDFYLESPWYTLNDKYMSLMVLQRADRLEITTLRSVVRTPSGCDKPIPYNVTLKLLNQKNQTNSLSTVTQSMNYYKHIADRDFYFSNWDVCDCSRLDPIFGFVDINGNITIELNKH